MFPKLEILAALPSTFLGAAREFLLVGEDESATQEAGIQQQFLNMVTELAAEDFKSVIGYFCGLQTVKDKFFCKVDVCYQLTNIICSTQAASSQ